MNDTAKTPTRIYPKDECQADPVFLVQSRRWICTRPENYEWDEYDSPCDSDGEPMDDDFKSESEDWDEEWEVECVFFDRDEAKRWAQAREYRWNAWRTYAVSAMGDLANILAPLTTYYDGEPYRKARHD